MQRLALSKSEIDDVVAFLAKLTSAQDQEQGVKEFGRHALSRMNQPQRDMSRTSGPQRVQSLSHLLIT